MWSHTGWDLVCIRTQQKHSGRNPETPNRELAVRGSAGVLKRVLHELLASWALEHVGLPAAVS